MNNSEQKFFFQLNNFDDEVIEDDLIDEEEEDLPPPPPLFTESELEAAKKKAFSDGHSQGTREVEESRAQALANMMQRLANDTHILFAAEKERETVYQREAVNLAKSMLVALYPRMHAEFGFDELTAQIGLIVAAQSGQRQIEIRTNPDFSEGVEGFMQKLQAQNSDLNFSVVADDTIPDSGFKMAWKDGGALYDLSKITQEVLGKFEEMLAGNGTTSHNERSEESKASGENLSDDTVNEEPIGRTEDETDSQANADNNPIAEDDND